MRHRFNVGPGCHGRGLRGERFGGGGRGDAFGPERMGGRGGRGGRLFESGELRLVLLLLIDREPRHGYDIIRAIEAQTGGTYAPSPGVIYPTLTLLEEMGYVEATAAEGGKKMHTITPAGRTWLAENRAAAEAAFARLDVLRQRAEAVDTGPIFRAMNNLKAVLRQRLSADAGKETLFAVADCIDEAARKIERL